MREEMSHHSGNPSRETPQEGHRCDYFRLGVQQRFQTQMDSRQAAIKAILYIF